MVYGLFNNKDVGFDVSVTATDVVGLTTRSAAEAGVAAQARAKARRDKYEATLPRTWTGLLPARPRGLWFRSLFRPRAA